MNFTRRTFIITAGAGVVASGLPVFASGSFISDSPAPADTFKLAVAGYTFAKFDLDKSLAMMKRVGVTLLGVKDFHLPLNSTQEVIDQTLAHHRELFETYREGLKDIPGIAFIGDDEVHQSSCWLATTLVENRDSLKIKLAENGIESDPVHYRNDRYSVFGKRVDDCPNMDA